MKLKLLLPLTIAASVVGQVSANEYQSFTSINYNKTKSKNYWDDYQSKTDSDFYSIASTYYFEDKKSLGPLAEFDYINTASNVNASYFYSDGLDVKTIGGEYISDHFLIGASYSKFDHFDTKSYSVGFLMNDNLLVKVEGVDSEDYETYYNYSVKYSIPLKGSDYLGFTYETDEDFDTHELSTTYFTRLSGQNYLKTTLNYFDSDYEDFWSIEGDYYFNKMTSIGLLYDEEDTYTVSMNHYFNNNLSLNLGYTNQEQKRRLGIQDELTYVVNNESLFVGVNLQF